PEQAKVVRRTFNGPSRIRGAAGTGKTVVGLHRAAHLARTRPGKVLVTSYVRTLPDVLSALFVRLAPEVADRVEFLGVHPLAGRILAEREVRYTLDGRKASALWKQIGRASCRERGYKLLAAAKVKQKHQIGQAMVSRTRV